MVIRLQIAFLVNTPAQVHFHKNPIRELSRLGHHVSVLARDYGETIRLLQSMNMDFFLYARVSRHRHRRITDLPGNVLSAYRHLRKTKPDILIDAGIYGAYTSRLLSTNSIVFSDSETTPVQFLLLNPFVNAIVTPSSFMRDLGHKHLRIDSYKELAYLHPRHYSPSEDILELLGVEKEESYVVLRFNAFDALHDLRISGLTVEHKRALVREIGKVARVFISCETSLPADLAKYSLNVPPERIHDVLNYSRLVVADTGTMVTEAACLGTPAVICHPSVYRYGNFVELEKRYGLVFCFDHFSEELVQKTLELVNDEHSRTTWRTKRERLLNDKIDPTQYVVKLIDQFPDSLSELTKMKRRGGDSRNWLT